MIGKAIVILSLFALLVAPQLNMDSPLNTPYAACGMAATLIGMPIKEYASYNILNFAYYKDKNYKGYVSSNYREFGYEGYTPSFGCAIVANVGNEVAMIGLDAHFLYASPVVKEVVKVPLGELGHVFPDGYHVRCYYKPI